MLQSETMSLVDAARGQASVRQAFTPLAVISVVRGAR